MTEHAHTIPLVVVVVQSPSCVWLFATPWTPALQASLSLHHLPKFAQVCVQCISDAVQPSHPLTPSSPSALDLSPHQKFFKWVICVHQMTKILKLQHQSFQWIFRVDLHLYWLVWSPCCPRDSPESSPAPQFEGINPLAFCLLYGPVLTTVIDHWEDHSLDHSLCQQSNVSAFHHTV